MLKDIWCAAQAGFKTALFAGDRRSLRKREDDERCKNHRPDAVVTELAQIPPMLGIAGENKMDKGEL
jgi:putative hydrolase of the HAD superfamily